MKTTLEEIASSPPRNRGMNMYDEMDLEAEAEGLAEMIEQENCAVDRDRLADILEEFPDLGEELLNATDPGGLVDEMEDMFPGLLDWGDE